MAGFIRSVTCRVLNESSYDLVLADHGLDHGSYDASPPPSIAAGADASWSSSTCGFMTGTEGRVAFHIGGPGGRFEVYWDNPFIGANTFTQSCGGLSDYQATQPHGEQADSGERSEPDRLTYDDDVIVNYVFRSSPVEDIYPDENEAEARDRAPDNRDPKAVELPPAEQALIRDADDTVRKIVFLGMNHNSADRELAAIANKLTAPNPKRMPYITAVTPSGETAYRRANDHLTNEDWAKKLVGMSEARRAQVVEMVANAPPRSPIRGNPTRSLQAYPRYELRRFIEIVAQVEEDLRQMAADEKRGTASSASPMKRLVISGHHRPRDGDDWYGFFYSYEYIFMDLREFEALSPIFPAAFAQVEDVLLIACNTGHFPGSTTKAPFMVPGPAGKLTKVMRPVDMGAWQILHRFPKCFPNIQTVWAYTNAAPNKQPAANAAATWEAASRRANAANDIEEARAKLRRSERWDGFTGFASILWVRQGNQFNAVTDKGQPASIQCV